ncbi:glycerol-3-phosphate 1-O-acyltransferase PlsY [Nereida sp. MMG025]|uniref:glycerol-3-phosphate 1-O-acyltransferase PlsY n=1 Tax=Nereida sp. MMG025 TaxID=2909981 RepID=UPI001F0015F8|nr:glycerol-3-phosphate 1-O-acyltransferase PlsY [Nereida sp. MMG025]MCF6444388.1 glycerol-3-phosphate 1-O-acyltransferase PlsY [Nereida sp. MMG025]
MSVVIFALAALFGFTLAALFGYLFGSIPFGLVMARLFGLGDLRTIGSGNIGATNVLRTGNKLAAFLTLILDAGKAGIAVLIAGQFGIIVAMIAGLAAFIGHCYPIWLRFKGGKGVATFFGLLFALAWPVGVGAGATWLAVAAITRYSSLSALFAAGLSPLWAWYLGYPALIWLLIALAALVFWTHRENIARLKDGSETKIGQK